VGSESICHAYITRNNNERAVNGHSVADSHFFKFIMSTIVAHRDKLEGQNTLTAYNPMTPQQLSGNFTL
jgi:hypothetical protein